MATREQDDGGMAQRLLDWELVSRGANKAKLAQMEQVARELRARLVEVISRQFVYRDMMEVMNDPTLDQLVALFWRVWKPIEMVAEKRIEEKPIKIGGRIIGTTKKRYTENVAKPVPFPGLRKIPPLDPVEFINQFPVEKTTFDEISRVSPVAAYLQSIGLTTIEAEIAQRSSQGLGSHRLNQKYYRDRVFEIRRRCPFYGQGCCGVIKLTSPAFPGRMGDQGKLQIEAGYDLRRENFQIRLRLNSLYEPVHEETFFGLRRLQGRLAEILVEKGITSVD